MIFAFLTLLSALALALVAGWFSIVGFMTIYAGQPFYALIMGAVTEFAKLVTTSWLYRNWSFSSWKLKLPLLYFTIALMTATSIGVFGFLSKAHLEQGSSTIDNSAKIAQIESYIARERSYIADNEKIINQLDTTVNSFLNKEKLEASVTVRKSQASQRRQLRDDIAKSQREIDRLNAEKFNLESEVRKMQLEVGPIRYIAELIYGSDKDSTSNIESAVKLFTLLIVSTLDPLAIVLLIAANHTLLRLRKEKDTLQDENNKTSETTPHISEIHSNTFPENMDEKGPTFLQESSEIPGEQKAAPAYEPDDGPLTNEQIEQVKETAAIGLAEEANARIAEIEHPVSEIEIPDEPSIQNNKEDENLINIMLPAIDHPLPIIRSPMPTSVAVVFDEGHESDENTDNLSKDKKKKILQSENLIIRELTGHHFIPKRIYDTGLYTKTDINNSFQNFPVVYPKSSSWINEYKGQENG